MMSLLSALQYYYLKRFSKLVYENRRYASECQEKIFRDLIHTSRNTAFGQEHHFEKIKTYNDFKALVPLRSYEQMLPFISKIFNGETSVAWPGIPAFFARTSGTTDNPKLLPVTKDFLRSTQYAARYMLCNLADQLKNARFIGDKVFYLTDHQNFEKINGFLCGAISAIKAYNMPAWTKRFALPGEAVNKIEDPFEKINAAIDVIAGQDIRMATALPVYLSHFLRNFELRTGKKFKESFREFSVLFLSGMNYEPYENFLRSHMGDAICIMENYSATEGNFAYQVVPGKKGMELICNQGIFYEFVPLEEINKVSPARICLPEVRAGKRYSIAISANNGLWAYMMNDIVEFVSARPYRLIVAGRLRDIFSPFGEHMLPIQAETAIAEACLLTGHKLIDFVITPDFNFSNYRYQCFAAFENEVMDAGHFESVLHEQLRKNNSYYDDLATISAVVKPQLIITDQNFFDNGLLRSSDSSSQQKTRHLVNDKNMQRMLKQGIWQPMHLR